MLTDSSRGSTCLGLARSGHRRVYAGDTDGKRAPGTEEAEKGIVHVGSAADSAEIDDNDKQARSL